MKFKKFPGRCWDIRGLTGFWHGINMKSLQELDTRRNTLSEGRGIGFWHNLNFLIIGECQGITESGNWIFLSAAGVATDFLHFSNFDIIDLSKEFVND
jgi:hypothetical protein